MTLEHNLNPITQGDDEEYTLNFTSGGQTEDITNWTVYVTVKESIDQSDSDAVITKDITSHEFPLEGETSFTFTSTETADLEGYYIYEIQIEKGDGTVKTIMRGNVEFTDQITERV